MTENRLPAELRARLETNPFRHQSNYVEWQGHKLLSETVCKRCGTTLSSIGPDPRIPPRRHELADTTKRTIIMETYTTRLLSSVHDTVKFEVEEVTPGGERHLGLHHTDICRTCKVALIDGVHDIEDVQLMYEADLERMAEADECQDLPEADTLRIIESLMNRRVVRVL